MKIQFSLLIISLIINLNAFASNHPGVIDPDSINDGPYFYFVDEELKVRWIENNETKESFVSRDNFFELKDKFRLSCNYEDLSTALFLKPHNGQSYREIDSIGIISDIHGEYSTYLNLLKGTGIIDNDLNWKFGKGHLAVLGDIFDRGDMVTEIFWHLFCLEKQAVKAGGRVHVLLGNHELMTLSKDLGYMNEKYRKVESLFKINYYDLYSEKSVLGKWLRSRPVAITINNILFVHAGISDEMVRRKMKIRKINRLFSDQIVGRDFQDFCQNEKLKFLDKENGPIWYRGYFSDPHFCESRLDSILAFYGKKHIIVGHTTNTGIKPLYDNKIMGVDSGIVIKLPGEMLIYKNGTFYRGLYNGMRIKL